MRKLDEAGTINLGKLSMHEFGLGMFLDFLIDISLYSVLRHEMGSVWNLDITEH